MARFLIVGEGERARSLARLVEGDGHIAAVERSPTRQSLEHVAVVCWLGEQPPGWFLERAIDSSVRGFLCVGSEPPAVALRNRIPVACLSPAAAEDSVPLSSWLREAVAGIAMLGIHLKGDRLS